MTGFSEDWLSLRESADTAARSVELLTMLQAWTQQHQTLNITDLGAGTGSNLRYLAPRLGGQQVWQLVDDDPALLAALPTLLSRWGDQQHVAVHEQAEGSIQLEGDGFSATIIRLQRDLSRPLTNDLFEGQHLLTASALLDLASREWMNGLAERLAERPGEMAAEEFAEKPDRTRADQTGAPQQNIACLFTLSVDGRIEWQPPLPDDKQVRDWFNQHQQSDKGLGLAAGPHAGLHMADALQRVGFSVSSATSDWQLDKDSALMQAALADGFLHAAVELSNQTETHAATDLHQWHARRREHWEARQSTLMVGHVDVLALPKCSESTN